MKIEVLVCHPGLQHSHQLALALHEAGMLKRFISGVPVQEDDKEWLLLPDFLKRKIKTVPIPKKLRQHPLYWQLILRLGSSFGTAGFKQDFTHRVFHWFDQAMAKEVLRLKPTAVVCFENSAVKTFEAAKRVGTLCVLDAPSFHYKTAESLISFHTEGYLYEINRRKELEVELADVILNCSPLASESYIEAGVDSTKVRSLLLGASLPQGLEHQGASGAPGASHFIFAGAMSERKSIDLILSVFSKLLLENSKAKLTIVGGSESVEWVKKATALSNVNYVGPVAQRELYDYMSRADCLLLPSRFDAFGMVVAEAMAVGIPAVVSDKTGAKAIIEDYPESGWIIEATEKQLYECINNILGHKYNMVISKKAAFKASHDYTWSAYRKRVINLFNELHHD